MKTRIRSVVGIAAAGVALWLAFSGVDVQAVAGSIRSANPLWLGAALLSVFLTLMLVVLRMRVLTTGWTDTLSMRMLWHVTILGQVANIVAPFRLGDGVKIVTGSRGLGLRAIVLGAIVAVERVFDVLGIVAASVLLLTVGGAPGWTSPVLAATAGFGLAGVAVACAASSMLAHGSENPTQSRGVYGFVLRQIEAVRDGVAHVRAPATLVQLSLGSAAIVLAAALTNYLTMLAFGLAVPPAAALLLFVLVQSGNAVVAAPGGIGVSQFLAIETLDFWGVPASDALAYSLTLFLIVRAPKIALLPGALAAISGVRALPEA